jgi:hypothetical protein
LPRLGTKASSIISGCSLNMARVSAKRMPAVDEPVPQLPTARVPGDGNRISVQNFITFVHCRNAGD